MKKITPTLLLVLTLSVILSKPLYSQISKSQKRSVLEVVSRFSPILADKVILESIEKQDGGDVFYQEIKSGKLIVKASSPVAACRGVYDFVRLNKYGICSWSGNRFDLPDSFDKSLTRNVHSPFEHRYYLNVVTYGYTLPYWNWQRWEREIDWMALHGIDMPLALVANEAISARVWRKLGLNDAEISEYFVGPAHLPWMRMGNVSKIDGPLPIEWHKDQIQLQHKILKRMRNLGMKPVCPGFAGFVPSAIKRLYPNLQLIETAWGGAFYNWMVSPEEALFQKIGKMFIDEWEKEFGKNGYYIVDSFNEMEIPFPPKNDPARYKLLASYGDNVYNSIKAGNKDAVWVMQGWMFGYQRDIWDYKTLEALVSKVPDDKMLLLDLAVDYSKHFWKNGVNWEFYKGFFNKPWVYSVIPNMGGKSGMTGILSFYANGHLEALNSPHKGRLLAYGLAPEGIENNEVIYELATDAAWSSSEINIRKWLRDYSNSRYGTYPAGMDDFWEGLLKSVYGSFTDHPRYNWQLRPGTTHKGSINANENYFEAIEKLACIAPQMAGNKLFELDFREWAADYLGAKSEILTQHIEQARSQGDLEKTLELEQKFIRWMKGIDALLVGHPNKDMQQWIGFARLHGGSTQSLADYYEKNARRIVTVWGPPVDDYSARIWAGLIRDYYLPRWIHFFEQSRTGQKFDFASWERHWVESENGLSPAEPLSDYLNTAIDYIHESAGVNNRSNKR